LHAKRIRARGESHLLWKSETRKKEHETSGVEDETEKDATDNEVDESGRACRQKGWWKRGDVEAKLNTVNMTAWVHKECDIMGGTCGSVHVQSFDKKMKALGVLESKWDPIRQKVVRRLLEEQDKCYGPTSHRRVGREVKGGKGFMAGVGNMSSGTCMREEGANSVRGPKLNDQIVRKGRVGKLGRVPEFLWLFVEFMKLSLIKLSL
jgi:hypothetical protein